MLRINEIPYTTLKADVKEQPKDIKKFKHKNNGQGFEEVFITEYNRLNHLKKGGDNK